MFACVVYSKYYYNYLYGDVQVCDLVAGPVLVRYDRFQHVDFLQPWHNGLAILLIPSPESSISLSAMSKPFQIPVRLFFLFM